MTEPNDTTSFNEINQLPTMKDVFDLIATKYPNWIVDLVDKYSDDYPHLQNNWQTLVNYSKTKMQKIVIVESFDNDEQLDQKKDHEMLLQSWNVKWRFCVGSALLRRIADS